MIKSQLIGPLPAMIPILLEAGDNSLLNHVGQCFGNHLMHAAAIGPGNVEISFQVIKIQRDAICLVLTGYSDSIRSV